jgi:ABC-type multidrug transport system permease subunit
MFVILGVTTILFEAVMALFLGIFSFPIFIVILAVYLCQGIFYRRYVTLFTLYYSEMEVLNDVQVLNRPQAIMIGAPINY